MHDELDRVFAVHQKVLSNVYNIRDNIVECEEELKQEITHLHADEARLAADEKKLKKEYLEVERMHEQHLISDEEYYRKEHAIEDAIHEDELKIMAEKHQEMDDKDILRFLVKNLEPMFTGHIE